MLTVIPIVISPGAGDRIREWISDLVECLRLLNPVLGFDVIILIKVLLLCLFIYMAFKALFLFTR